MKIFKKLLPSANIYLVIFKKEAIIFDTGDHYSRTKILNFLKWNLNGRKLSYIFITHSHWDHVGNVKFLKRVFSPKIVMAEKEKEWMGKGYIDIPNPKGTLYSLFLYNFLKFFSNFENIEKFKPDITVSKYQVLMIDNQKVEIFPTPGHTPGSLTFKIEKYAFTGDTLLGPNPFLKRPRLSMFLHDREEIFKSINLLKEMDVEIYFPGHGFSFTKEELQKFSSILYNK